MEAPEHSEVEAQFGVEIHWGQGHPLEVPALEDIDPVNPTPPPLEDEQVVGGNGVPENSLMKSLWGIAGALHAEN
ncbi:hypothetical protein BDV93DRAFT_522775 [Ceratobasidium sp. AG-I]|nr:hypothetical protein BDV93DRAFT_522775 [Ceratobasidium sp. AG-I]